MARFIILSEPRCGSTFLVSLLRQHRSVHCDGEILNEENGPLENPIFHLENHLSQFTHARVGFKISPQQIIFHRLKLSDLVRHLDVKWIIVNWRRNCLETLASLMIAKRTNQWCSENPVTDVETVDISKHDLQTFLTETEERWKLVTDGWPPDVVPIFVNYEELVQNKDEEMKKLLRRMSLSCDGCIFESWLNRQNPAPLHLKVSTFVELNYDETLTIDVPSIVNKAVLDALKVDEKFTHMLPEKEPPVPPEGWRYKVAEPYVTEAVRNNVVDAVDSHSLSSAGYWCTELGKRLRNKFGVAVAQPCCNGFAALVLALKAAEIGPGDEVIIPSFTMIAVANAVSYVGATLIPIDNAEDSYNPELNEIKQAITKHTKAIIVTHTYGVPVKDIESIACMCLKENYFLIEDISECAGISVVGCDGMPRLLGTYGHFACASMYANKILHAGDGGFVLAKDPRMRYTLASLVNHGFTGSYHFVHLQKAPNFKMSGLAAAVACAVLQSSDEIVKHRSVLARTYRQNLRATPLKMMPTCGPDDTPWVFGIECSSLSQRNKLRDLLGEYGVETRNYFFPIHAQPAYSDLFSSSMRYPNCEKLAVVGLYLPSYTTLCQADIEWICSVVSFYFNSAIAIGSPPVSDNSLISVRLNQKTLQLDVREFNRTGKRVTKTENLWFWSSAIANHLDMERFMSNERWDVGQQLLQKISENLTESKTRGLLKMDKVLISYKDYIMSQQKLEIELTEPWANEDITSGDFGTCQTIPTLTEIDVFRMLCWFIRTTRVKTILEIGPWLGGSTAFMATAAKHVSEDAKVFTVDSFIWSSWMNRFVKGHVLNEGESFLNLFLHYTQPVSTVVRPVKWEIGSEPFPSELFRGQVFDLIFLDFTKVKEDIQELLILWSNIERHLKSGETIVVIHPLNIDIAPFVAHCTELVPIAKPRNTTAKAFRYVKPSGIPISPATCVTSEVLPLRRRLCFRSTVDWVHHYRRGFSHAISALRESLHSSDAAVDFIPSVGEFFCDLTHAIDRPWIGIVHGVIRDDLFYPPDLERLCSKRYKQAMSHCRGLFTLTELQNNYLKQHLQNNSTIPICTLALPATQPRLYFDKSCITHWMSDGELNLLFVGSFGRDYQLFFDIQIPEGLKKMLLAGDEVSQESSLKAPADVVVVQRLSDDDYETLLCRSIVFLAMKFDGAANTVVVECIVRNIPIVVPRISSCTEYLGSDYPLMYDSSTQDFCQLITSVNVNAAIKYLENCNKSRFTIEHFCKTVELSSVLLSIPAHDDSPTRKLTYRFDVTVCICSYKRTHHLEEILKSLLVHQDFEGSIEVIVWNNWEPREGIVRQICEPFIKRNSNRRSLTLISSTKNYYCIIRACLSHLSRSDAIVICDDDIIPRNSFIQFFMDAHRRHPNDVIGVRGHIIVAHEFDHQNALANCFDRRKVRFVDDSEPEQFIHFIHADTCLLPQKAVREFASVPLPDNGYDLVDDYWMCFVLSHYFGRSLRKLEHTQDSHFQRTSDSDQVQLAMYTRPEVRDARVRMYIHHMLRGWPKWSAESKCSSCPTDVANFKQNFWRETECFFGFNVPNTLNHRDVIDIQSFGVKVVRIGAVGTKEVIDDSSNFLDQPAELIHELRQTVDLLKASDINVIITLHRKLASTELWSMIAAEFYQDKNVVGYDLINEPYLAEEEQMHWSEVSSANVDRLSQYVDEVINLIGCIRRFDSHTTVIVESTFWGSYHALHALKSFMSKLKSADSNLVISIHFYNPATLTTRYLNRSRFGYPGKIPIFDNPGSEMEDCNDVSIKRTFDEIRQWQNDNDTVVLVGEFGIAREVAGAAEYLRAVGGACQVNGLSCLIYSFREETWDAMNYELGPMKKTTIVRTPMPWNENCLMSAIRHIASSYNQL